MIIWECLDEDKNKICPELDPQLRLPSSSTAFLNKKKEKKILSRPTISPDPFKFSWLRKFSRIYEQAIKLRQTFFFMGLVHKTLT